MSSILCLISLLLAAPALPAPTTSAPPKWVAEVADLTAAKRKLEAEYEIELARANLAQAQAQAKLAEEQARAAHQRFKLGEVPSDLVAKREAELAAARANVQRAEAEANRRRRELELLGQELKILAAEQDRRAAVQAVLEKEVADLQHALQTQERRAHELTLAENCFKCHRTGAAQAKELLKRNEKSAHAKAVGDYQLALKQLYSSRDTLAARRTQLQVARDGAGKQVSVEFPEPMPGSVIIHQLFNAAGMSYVTDAYVTRLPRISMKLKDVPFERALSIVAEALGIKYEVRDGVYFIKSAEAATAATGSSSARYGDLTRKDPTVVAFDRVFKTYPAPSVTSSTKPTAPSTAVAPPPPVSVTVAPQLAAPSVVLTPTVATVVPQLVPPAAAATSTSTQRATFVCPHCKRQETIAPTERVRQGYWKFCPFCGKAVK